VRSYQIAQGFAPLGLKKIQGWSLPKLSGQPVPLPALRSACPHGGKVSVSSLNRSSFCSCLLYLVALPCMAVTGPTVPSSSPKPPLPHAGEPLLPWSRTSSPALSIARMNLLLVIGVFLALGGTKPAMASRCGRTTSAWQRGQPKLLAVLLLLQPWMLLAISSARAYRRFPLISLEHQCQKPG